MVNRVEQNAQSIIVDKEIKKFKYYEISAILEKLKKITEQMETAMRKIIQDEKITRQDILLEYMKWKYPEEYKQTKKNLGYK